MRRLMLGNQTRGPDCPAGTGGRANDGDGRPTRPLTRTHARPICPISLTGDSIQHDRLTRLIEAEHVATQTCRKDFAIG